MRRGAVAVVLVLLAGCGGQSKDGQFLSMVRHNATLAGEPSATLVTLGHEACDLLDKYGGDESRVDADFVATAGPGGRAFFSPAVMGELRLAATTVYCP